MKLSRIFSSFFILYSLNCAHLKDILEDNKWPAHCYTKGISISHIDDALEILIPWEKKDGDFTVFDSSTDWYTIQDTCDKTYNGKTDKAVTLEHLTKKGNRWLRDDDTWMDIDDFPDNEDFSPPKDLDKCKNWSSKEKWWLDFETKTFRVKSAGMTHTACGCKGDDEDEEKYYKVKCSQDDDLGEGI